MRRLVRFRPTGAALEALRARIVRAEGAQRCQRCKRPEGVFVATAEDGSWAVWARNLGRPLPPWRDDHGREWPTTRRGDKVDVAAVDRVSLTVVARDGDFGNEHAFNYRLVCQRCETETGAPARVQRRYGSPTGQRELGRARVPDALAAALNKVVSLGGTVRALTLQRPWDCAVAHGGKAVENRSWRPRHLGELVALHAGKAYDHAGEPLIVDRMGRRPEEHEPGIFAVARVGAILEPGTVVDGLADGVRRWYLGPSYRGARNYGWILDDLVVLPQRVRCRGFQGLFPLPRDVADAVSSWCFLRAFGDVPAAPCGAAPPDAGGETRVVRKERIDIR